MSDKIKQKIFEDFQSFYVESVKQIKISNPDFIRLDGAFEGSNRQAFGYFKYQNEVWKVDADTYIEKLDIALMKSLESNNPFLIRLTRGRKSKCLIIANEPLAPKRFYVYQSNIKIEPKNK